MIKRIGSTVLTLLCLGSAALAEGMPLSTDLLPACYQYPVAGACVVYADAPVPVYTLPSDAGPVIGYVAPEQTVSVDEIDWDAQMVRILYDAANEEKNWNFGENSASGWIETRYVTNFADFRHMWVVSTDKPGDRLNLRTKPAYDSPSLGKYYAGTVVWQQGEPTAGYLKVKVGHMIGYMDMSFLKPGLYTPDAELPLLQVTDAHGATIRKLPQDDSEAIKTAPRNAYVTALATRTDGWVQVRYENETGYAREDSMSPELSY